MATKLRNLFTLNLLLGSVGVMAQALVIQAGGSITTTAGSTIVVQGSVQGAGPITGAGKLIMSGTTASTLDMGGQEVSNLEIDNAAGVSLVNSATLVSTNLNMVNGKLILGSQNLIVDPDATITGQTGVMPARFIETNGTGEVQKQITANITNYEVPVGEGANYRPATITTTGTAAANSYVGIRNKNGAPTNKPVSTISNINTNWPVTRVGTGYNATVSGKYLDADIVGTEADLRGYYNNGTSWSSVSGTNDATNNLVSAPATAAAGTLSGINKFVLLAGKVFLQGAYTTAGGGSMTQSLRTLMHLPTTTPYGTGVYATTHPQVNNPLTETSSYTVFNANNIVDWVQLQLRNTNASPGNTVLQTRSALLKSNGDIVDLDGVSPITFNNIPNGTNALTVRHRNHLALSSNPTMGGGQLAASESAVSSFDFTNPASSFFGTSAAYRVDPTNNKVLLWCGNVNGNANVRYGGSSNDVGQILVDLGGVSSNILNGYHRGDVNMNGVLRYGGSSNDVGVILSSALSGISSTIRFQEIPN